MKKELKELVESAIPYKKGIKIDNLYIMDSGKKYRIGTHTNGFNKMIVLGTKNHGENVYLLTDHSDLATIKFSGVIDIDINSEYGCVRLCFNNPIKSVQEEILSTLDMKIGDNT